MTRASLSDFNEETRKGAIEILQSIARQQVLVKRETGDREFEKQVRMLLSLGLVRTVTTSERTSYEITETGSRFLEGYPQVERVGLMIGTRRFIEDFLQEFATVARTISVSDIENAVEVLFEAWQSGNNVFIIGNGGSASTASHFACDLAKGTAVEGKRRFGAVSLTDNVPLITALTNDNGFNAVFVEQLKGLLRKGDVVIAISVHGGTGQDKAGVWSQNLLAAIQYAKENLAKTIGLAGFDGGALKQLADVCIVVPAESTPYVESWHAALEHLICNCLRERIEQS